MGQYRKVEKVKHFIGIITKFIDEVGLIKSVCEKQFGQVSESLEPLLFNFTDYYKEEQGEPLYRIFYSFDKLIFPNELVKIKRWTNFMEEKLKTIKCWNVSRPFNLDPGYVSLSQVVLASTKPYSHRLYLGNNIYGEITLIFRGGSFIPMPWTYRDYKTKEYIGFFNEVREQLKMKNTLSRRIADCRM